MGRRHDEYGTLQHQDHHRRGTRAVGGNGNWRAGRRGPAAREYGDAGWKHRPGTRRASAAARRRARTDRGPDNPAASASGRRAGGANRQCRQAHGTGLGSSIRDRRARRHPGGNGRAPGGGRRDPREPPRPARRDPHKRPAGRASAGSQAGSVAEPARDGPSRRPAARCVARARFRPGPKGSLGPEARSPGTLSTRDPAGWPPRCAGTGESRCAGTGDRDAPGQDTAMRRDKTPRVVVY